MLSPPPFHSPPPPSPPALRSLRTLSEAQHRHVGNVGALVHRLDLFHSSMPLAWMGISSRTDLDNQQRGLSEQLNSLVKARLIRGRSEPMRLAARKKLHMCEGKREVYEKVVDGQIGLDFESISKEIG